MTAAGDGGAPAPIPRLGRGIRSLLFAGLALIVVAAAAWATGFGLFVRSIARTPPPHAEPTDAIVVLTGGPRRLAAAVELLLAGRAKALLVSGVNQVVREADITQLLAEAGVTLTDATMECCVSLGYGALDTSGNAEEAAEWMRSGGYRSLTLVTSNYHMPRALIEFRDAMPDTTIREHPVIQEDLHVEDWWRWPGSRSLIVSEYLKFQAAWLRALAG